MTQPSLDLTKAEALAQILPATPQVTSEQARWKNVTLAYYRDHPAGESPGASFQQYALEVIDEGSGSPHERRLEDVYLTHPLRSGEACFCPARTHHWAAWEQPLSFTVLAFRPAFFEQLSQQVLECVNKASPEQKRIEFVPRWQVFDPVIQRITAALRLDLEAGCPAGPLYGESFGTSLAVHLISRFSALEPRAANHPSGLSDARKNQVLDFIEANLDTDICLEDLANLVGISTFYFCRLFKQTMQITPHQYVIRRRIERAKSLLTHSNITIVEVALACGFANQSHLSRHFRRIVGLSPKVFRQR